MSHEYGPLGETGQVVAGIFIIEEANDIATKIATALAPHIEFTRNFKTVNNLGDFHTVQEEKNALNALIAQKEAGLLTEKELEAFNNLFLSYHDRVIFNFRRNYPKTMRRDSLDTIRTMLRKPDLDEESRRRIIATLEENPGCDPFKIIFGN